MNELPQLQDATLEISGRVATLTLNRDDVRNALTGTGLVTDIVDTVRWVNREEAISVLVLTGAGSAFSAGGNIKEMRERSGAFAGDVLEVQQRYRRGIQTIPVAMHGAEVPIIAAVNGPAIGAGFDLACMCDLRIASTQALFGETFINLGIIPGDGGAWFLQRLIGYQRAAELTLTGRLVKADEALELGLVLEITTPDQLLERTAALAAQIAAKPPQTVRFTKRLLKMAQRQELSDFLDISACFQGMCHNTEDHREAVNAFLEKRTGSYRGS
ncbi:MAG: enoyl-CoA hydratase/isomerase family protein [Gammaproteobacteria bacterium]|nr:enoyl-CoA hydratase/isomerase family protein [Gammaproteobacteria bacterium]